MSDEMINLALDGGLLWMRWALRRIGYFSEGRPASLISDLIGEPQNFRAGTLARRLMAANLPALEPHHQRSIGVAVGQRVMRETFVVRWDGLEPCLDSDDLTTWTRDYRIGLAYGLWFDPEDRITLTARSVKEALQVLEPVPDCAAELAEWINRVAAAWSPSGLPDDWAEANDAERYVRSRIPLRPVGERLALESLADHIKPEPPF